MEQITPVDSNNAFVQVRQAIKGLMDIEHEDNEDDVIYTTNKLKSVLRMVHDNYQSWSSDVIREFVLSKHDPLRNIHVKSDKLNYMVRQIQQDMIIKFS